MSEKNTIKQSEDFLDHVISEREILEQGLAQSRRAREERIEKGATPKKNPVRIFSKPKK